jgi:hypothetical protein
MLDEQVFAGPAVEPDRAEEHRRPLLWRLAGNARALIWLIPLGLGIVYLVVFLVELRHNLGVINWISDYASEFVVPETLVKTGTGGHTILNTSGQYVSLWFGLLTAWLPFHRLLWEAAPVLLFLLTALAISWSVAQVADRRAAILAALMALVISPWAWSLLIAPGAHNTVFPCTALLGVYLIWLTRGEGRRRSIAFTVPLLAGLGLGACIGSDALNIAGSAIPLGLTALLAGLRRPRRSRLLALSALVTVVTAIPIAKLTSSVMAAQGFVTLPPEPHLTALSELPAHLKVLVEGFRFLFNGYLGRVGETSVNSDGPLHTQLGLACMVFLAIALAALLIMGSIAAARLIWSGWSKGRSETPAQLARAMHIIYWVCAGLIPCAVFVLNTRTDTSHFSYYETIVFAVAALVPLLMRSGPIARWLIPVGVSVSFLASIVGLNSHYVDAGEPHLAAYASMVVKLAEARHVTNGYAGYWDAASLTWSSRGHVTARPVVDCATEAGEPTLCPFVAETVPAWYRPKRGPSFLILEAGEHFLPEVPPILGRPVAVYTSGPITMYFYSYDIASRLEPPSWETTVQARTSTRSASLWPSPTMAP